MKKKKAIRLTIYAYFRKQTGKIRAFAQKIKKKANFFAY